MLLASSLAACNFSYSGSAKLDVNGLLNSYSSEVRTREQRMKQRRGGEVLVISDVRAGVTIVLDRPAPNDPLQSFMTPAVDSPLKKEGPTVKDYELESRFYPWTRLSLNEGNWTLQNPSEGYAVVFDCREMLAGNAISCMGKVEELQVTKEEYSGLGIQALNELQLTPKEEEEAEVKSAEQTTKDPDASQN